MLLQMIQQRNFFISTLILILFITMTGILASSSACTIFTVSMSDKVFFGNSEDYYREDTYIWFKMPWQGEYGGVYFGFGDIFVSPQGGMNEKGLCFDCNGLPRMSLNDSDLPYVNSLSRWVVPYIMDNCDNVSHAIQVAQEFHWGTSISYQVHFADSLGDAVVIHGGTDGAINFSRKGTGEGFLISTNFNLGYPQNGWSPCWRYLTVTEILENMNHEENLTIEAMRDILDVVHQEGEYATKYSNIFDLVHRDIYIYQNHNFSSVVKLNLDEELAKDGDKTYSISDLFALDTSQYTTDTPSNSTQVPTSQTNTAESTHWNSLFFFFVLSVLILITIRRKGS
jgi:hypothetical protein